jgi:hypothetical protein
MDADATDEAGTQPNSLTDGNPTRAAASAADKQPAGWAALFKLPKPKAQQGQAASQAASAAAAASAGPAAAGPAAAGLSPASAAAGPGPAQEQQGNPGAVLLPVQQYDPVRHACWQAGQPVPYLHLARAFQAIDTTTKRLRIADALTNMFRWRARTAPHVPHLRQGLLLPAMVADVQQPCPRIMHHHALWPPSSP